MYQLSSRRRFNGLLLSSIAVTSLPILQPAYGQFADIDVDQLLEMLLYQRRDLVRRLNAETSPAPSISGQPRELITAIAVIGGLILSAYKISQEARSAASSEGAVTILQAGMTDLNQQVTFLQSKIDGIAAQLTNILPQISKIIDDKTYANILRSATARVKSSTQDLRTYMSSKASTVSKRDIIELSLREIQNSVNDILSANDLGPRLDGHLVASGWVSLWRQSYDVANRLWSDADPTYVPIYSENHFFFTDYAFGVRALLQNSIQTKLEIDDWISSTVIVENNREVYRYKPNKTFERTDIAMVHKPYSSPPNIDFDNLFARDINLWNIGGPLQGAVLRRVQTIKDLPIYEYRVSWPCAVTGEEGNEQANKAAGFPNPQHQLDVFNRDASLRQMLKVRRNTRMAIIGAEQALVELEKALGNARTGG